MSEPSETPTWRPRPEWLSNPSNVEVRQLFALAEIADTLKDVFAAMLRNGDLLNEVVLNTGSMLSDEPSPSPSPSAPSTSDAKPELRTIGGWEEYFKTADADDLARTRADLNHAKDHLGDALSMLKRAHQIMGEDARPSTVDDFRADVAPLIKSIEAWLVVR